MIRKILLVIMILALAAGCSTKNETEVSEEVTETEFFTIEGAELGGTYAALQEVYFSNMNDEKGLLQLPSIYTYNDHRFECDEFSVYRWNVSVDDSEDLTGYIEELNSYAEGFEDISRKEVLEYNTSCQMYLEFTDGHVEYYTAFLYKDLRFCMYISYNPSDLTNEAIAELHQMSLIYLLDYMELPNEKEPNLDDIDEEFKDMVPDADSGEENYDITIVDESENTIGQEYPNGTVE